MDISEQISSLLNSPDGMDKIRSVAASLLGGGDEDSSKKSEKPNINLPVFSDMADTLGDAGSIQSIIKVVSAFKNLGDDKRVNLLLALKPHLSKERAARVDKAVGILKIASLLPILKDEGVLDNLF